MFYDLIIVAILIVFIIMGYHKGLVMSVLRLVAWILSFILAKLLSPMVSVYISGTEFFQTLQQSIREKLLELQAAGFQNFEQSIQKANQGQGEGLIADLLLEGLKSGKVIDTQNILDFLSLSIAQAMVQMGSLVAVFVLVSLLISLLLRFIKGIVSLPVIKQLDKAGGLLFGLLQGIVIAYIVVMLFNLLHIGGIQGQFDNTLIVKHFLNFDLLKQGYLMVKK